MKNVIYFSNINVIGGVETFFYYLAKKYGKTHDINFYYDIGDPQQIKRLAKYARVQKYCGEEITCETAIFNYNLGIIDHVHAKEYIQVIHGDYKALGIQPFMSDKITRYVSVSELVQGTFEEVTGKKSEVCYNPVLMDEPKKVPLIVSASRLEWGNGKGKERIEEIGRRLNEANMPYLWLVFTADTDPIRNPNIIYMKPSLNIVDYIKKADLFAQLSDSESFCYSVVEALSLGTPCLVTRCPVFEELGLDDSNSIKVNFDLSDLDVKKIYNGLPRVKYSPPPDRWGEILAKGQPTYEYDKGFQYRVRATDRFQALDIREAHHNRVLEEGEEFIVNFDSLQTLLGANIYNTKFVDLIETIKGGKINDNK